MKIQAKSDWVIIEPLGDDKNDSPVFLFGREKANRDIGIVVSIGRGRIDGDKNTIPSVVSSGDKVFYDSRGASYIELGENKYNVVRHNKLWGKVQ